MNAIVFAANCAVYLTTVLLQAYFLNRTLPRKAGMARHLLITAFFISLRLAAFATGLPYRPLIEIGVSAVYACVAFQCTYVSRLVWSAIPVFLDAIADAATFSVYYSAFAGTSLGERAEGVERAMVFLAANAVTFGMYYLITRNVEKDRAVTLRSIPYLFLIPCGCFIALNLNYAVSRQARSVADAFLLMCDNVFLLALALGSIALYNQTVAQERALARSNAMLRTTKLTEDHISHLTELCSRISFIRHGIKTHLTAISGYIAANDIVGAKTYISDVASVIDAYVEYTTRPAINAVISSRAKAAMESNIDFQADLMLPVKASLSDAKLCALIGNMLDNAFEANSSNRDGKYIFLAIYTHNAQMIICCRNSTDCPGRYLTTDALQSTKRDGGIHGVGTRHIKRIVEEAGGFVTFRHVNHEFTAFAAVKAQS